MKTKGKWLWWFKRPQHNEDTHEYDTELFYNINAPYVVRFLMLSLRVSLMFRFWKFTLLCSLLDCQSWKPRASKVEEKYDFYTLFAFVQKYIQTNVPVWINEYSRRPFIRNNRYLLVHVNSIIYSCIFFGGWAHKTSETFRNFAADHFLDDILRFTVVCPPIVCMFLGIGCVLSLGRWYFGGDGFLYTFFFLRIFSSAIRSLTVHVIN